MKEYIYKASINAIAEYLANSFEQELKTKPQISVALSGGNTPQALFAYWSSHLQCKSFWHNIQYFWVDERAVPPQHAESNYGIAHTLFFEPMQIASGNIQRIKGECLPMDEAARYHELLKNTLPLVNGIPQFDFVLLGIGDDGHTASIFPGQEHLFVSESWCSTSENPYTKQQRITLTGPIINNARNTIFVVTGEPKKTILQEIQHSNTKKYPAMYVSPTHNVLKIISNVLL